MLCRGLPSPVTVPAIAPLPVLAVAAVPAGLARLVVPARPARPVSAPAPDMVLAIAGGSAGAEADRVVRNVTGASARAWPEASVTVLAPLGQEAPPDHWST